MKKPFMNFLCTTVLSPTLLSTFIKSNKSTKIERLVHYDKDVCEECEL